MIFDFYIPEYNLIIEYDGEQHFKSLKFFGGERRYIKQKEYDTVKNKYCKNKDINIIRISYKDNIIRILKNIF